jgi:type II secretory pathway component PulF
LSDLPKTEGAIAGARGGAISLDELIALNDEIAALVRAGVPLERGLLDVGGDLTGRLRSITNALGERMSRGEGLLQALEGEGERLPGIYRAVVEAGLRTGRLSVALEGLAIFARQYAEMRRAIGLALVYPLVVLTLAYGLFAFFVWQIAPRFLAAAESLQVPSPRALSWLSGLGDSVRYWWPIGPAALLLIGLWWARSGRGSLLQPSGGGRALAWLPWMKTMFAHSRSANFAELLALLLEHGVPFPDGIALAAEATGDAELRRAAGEIAAAGRRGDSLAESVRGAKPVPPLLRWLIATGRQPETLVPALRHAAQTYRRRAILLAEFVRVFLPVILLFAIGVTATLLYGLTLFVPFSAILNSLAAPSY